MLVTCPCNHCGGRIQFAEEEFRELGSGPNGVTGQTIPCPHCGAKTTLFIPRKATGSGHTTQFTKREPEIAGKEKRGYFFWFGLALTVTGAVVALIGVCGLAMAAKEGLVFRTDAAQKTMESAMGMIYSAGALLCVVTIGIGLSAMGQWLQWRWMCANCGNQVTKESVLCPSCGACFAKRNAKGALVKM
jgi:DNA-directed RNA polymerase subunit RPC12/RpoP